ncbi:DNA-binding response regulator [Virgisporangium aliadipatigenens]|uniref:DNA-binding response regulator n=1 Tax=Virgisporangium aliadipatigenens TaxID=741659 RepID=A0A8J3YPH6_9ACTN|nr:response regulator transcription factor [Virgisporangium aliadipatigenens]GIJ48182.1 DNA-binding response regulator [Virgisporangium aliadipatigenens]
MTHRTTTGHVLVADGDRTHAEALRRHLESNGYRTTTVRNPRDASEQIRRLAPDLVALDITMLTSNDFEIHRFRPRRSPAPALVLTAHAADDNLMRGLESGADDYLIKPYDARELLVRVRAVLRRVDRVATGPKHRRVGAITVDSENHTVTVGGREIDCTPAEFAILEAMTRRPAQIFSRAQLRQYASGRGGGETNRVIDTHVLNLRRKIEPNPRRPDHLLTVYGLGYKLVDGGMPADGPRGYSVPITAPSARNA